MDVSVIVRESAITAVLIIIISWLYYKYFLLDYELKQCTPFFVMPWLIFYGVCRGFSINYIFVIALGIFVDLVCKRHYFLYNFTVDIHDKHALIACKSWCFPTIYRCLCESDAKSYTRGNDVESREDTYKYLLYLMGRAMNSEKRNSSGLTSSQFKLLRKFLEIENDKYSDDKCIGDDYFQYMLDNPEEDMLEYVTKSMQEGQTL